METNENILIDFTLYNFNQGYSLLLTIEKVDENFKENMENYFKNKNIEISFPLESLTKQSLEKIKEIEKDFKEIFLRVSFSKIVNLENYTYSFNPLSIYNISLSQIDLNNEKITFYYNDEIMSITP